MALIVVHKHGRFESREKVYCGHTASDRKDGNSPHNSQLLLQAVGLEDRPGLEDWQATSGSKVQIMKCRASLHRNQAPHVQTTVALCRKMLTRQ
mmetsp:Transcript_30185/g.99884  ORF Transcript_30185/g.99884 Transcript_30185/m.99884 type:complete len:94 (-) Transcript_30185:1390-1671(-)